jgi:hypothetical protein
VTIAHQSAMTDTGVRARPPAAGTPHELAPGGSARRAWTVAKIAGLVAVAVLGLTLAVGIVVGGALFTIMNFS